MTSERISRRDFLKICGISTTGLLLGATLPGCQSDNLAEYSLFSPGPWLSINDQGEITVYVSKMEMGQGLAQSLANLVANELNVDSGAIIIKMASVKPEYGSMMTAGSRSIRQLHEPVKRSARMAGYLLVVAASKQSGVVTDKLRLEQGFVVDIHTNSRWVFSDLVDTARNLSAQNQADVENWYAKQPINTIDHSDNTHSLNKLNGKFEYAIDVDFEGLSYAAIVQAPVVGALVKDLSYPDLKQNPHIFGVYKFDTYVAVLADNIWRAQQFIKQVNIQWSKPASVPTTEALRKTYLKQLAESTQPVFESGSLDADAAVKEFSLDFETPLQAHLCMEPMNCTVAISDGVCDIWVPTQDPQGVQNLAKRLLSSALLRMVNKVKNIAGISPDYSDIRVHAMPMGGGFGRRLEHDYVAQAIEISLISGRAVQLIWSREQDVRHDYFKPYTAHRLTLLYDEENQGLHSLQQRLVGPLNWLMHGANDGLLYKCKHHSVEYHNVNLGIKVGFWRSVSEYHKVFAYEVMINQLSQKLGEHPVKYRLAQLKDEHKPMRDLLSQMSRKYDSAVVQANTICGIAAHHAYDSSIVLMAVLNKHADTLVIEKLICIVDCGYVLNAVEVKKQIKGGVVFALSALSSAVTLDQSGVQQSNYHDFKILRFDDVPDIEVDLISSERSPGGVGELSVPVVAPAVANALFEVSGAAITQLPIPEKLFSVS